MILKSEIIQKNIEKVEQAKKDFSLLKDYSTTTDDRILRTIWDEGRSYGFLTYMNFIDFERFALKTGQEIFYKKKIKLPHFKEILINNATDESVKKILKSKGKVSFEKLLNSRRWDVLSGNRRRRGGVRYHDNFVSSAAIIANFCIQNEVEIEDVSRISDYYRSLLPELDPTIKAELELTKNLIEYLVVNLSDSQHDFKRLNIEHISKFISEELKRKLTNIEKGESVKLIENTDYYGGLSFGKVYEVVDKEISSGRLQVVIKNDVGNIRSYPYRLFETVSNLREDALLKLLSDI
jgi:hypothetical protein